MRPIKGNVKRKILPIGSMPTFFSRHSAHPFERPLLLPRVVLLRPKVLLRFRVRSGETLLPRGSIFTTVKWNHRKEKNLTVSFDERSTTLRRLG